MVTVADHQYKNDDDISDVAERLQIPATTVAELAEGINAGVGNAVRKGFWPYRFPYSPGYVGRLPLPELFCMANKSPKEVKEFDVWYEERRKTPWDFDKEAEAYCRNDVRVLAAAISAYKKRSLELT